MRRFGKALGAFTVAASLTGCGMTGMAGIGSNSFKAHSLKAKADGAEWTIFLHLAASNNLEPFAYINLNEAEASIDDKKINFIVLFDGQKKGDSKIMKVVKDPNGMNKNIVSQTIDDKGAIIPKDTKEIDSGDYKTVSKFVTWGVQNYPAKKYAFMSWDHGSGLFMPNGQRVNVGPGVDRMALRQRMRDNNVTITPQGFGWDDESGNHVTTAQFTDILKAGSAAIGQPFDLAGFDACLMGHVELAYQMQGHAKNLVASEELEPGLGWDYNLWMKYLSANVTTDGEGNAAALIKGYGESYAPGGAHHGGRQADITLSNLSYDAVKNDLTPALNNLAVDLTSQLASNKAAITTARNNAQEFYNSDCADLGSFLGNLESAGVSRDATRAVRAAYKKSVTAETHAGSGMAGATGAVVYFPKNKWSWKKDYDDAGKIAFSAEKWRGFLVEFIK